jgi:4-hydroxybenzoyl-CoA thioesterase
MVNAVVEDWFAEMGEPFETLRADSALAVPTVQFRVAFPAPSRLGDVLEFRLTPTRIGASSLDLDVEAHMGTQARLTMNTTLVQMNLDTGKSAPWSAEMKQKIQKYMKG